MNFNASVLFAVCVCKIRPWHCRDAASAELELDQLQEVQLAFQKMDIYSGAADSIYQSLAQAMGWLLQWLKGKADGGSLASKGYEQFEGVWAGHQVLYAVAAAVQRSLNCDQNVLMLI